jgi:hypothetical protein
MELNKVNRFSKFYESNRIQNKGFSQNQGSKINNLTQDELNMIHKEFPKSSGVKLDLYMSTGKAKTENPNAKGGNIDFKI